MIDIRIQHHHSRQRHLKLLMTSLETDISHKTKVSVVEDEVSCWSGCKKALQSGIESGADYICVLQDDVLACRDFIPTIEKITKIVSDKPITLFTPNDMAGTARSWQRSWMTIKLWFYAQGYILPRDMAIDFLEFADKHTNDRTIDDEKLAIWIWKRDLRVWATMPSLVEHIGWHSTTIRSRSYDAYYNFDKRVAKYFIGYERSGLDVDWHEGIDCPVQDEHGAWKQLVDNYVS
jgi:GR25 family glycosyltransferase involved in LPS biosynthesis